MSKYLKVEGNSSLVREVSSQAIINKNDTDYKSYMLQKEALRSRRLEIQQQAAEINNLKEDLAEIKSMLQNILGK